jgi:hypothetical protein
MSTLFKVPPGTSASTWKSVLIGRILGLQMRYVEDQSLLHLYPTDVRRLYNLRRGRVPEAEHTDDDHELLLIGAAYWPIAATPITGDDWAAKIDPADPGPNALDYLLAKEAQPDEIQADHRRNIAIQRHKLAKRRNAGIKANETRRKKLTPQSVGTCEPDGNLEGT